MIYGTTALLTGTSSSHLNDNKYKKIIHVNIEVCHPIELVIQFHNSVMQIRFFKKKVKLHMYQYLGLNYGLHVD